MTMANIDGVSKRVWTIQVFPAKTSPTGNESRERQEIHPRLLSSASAAVQNTARGYPMDYSFSGLVFSLIDLFTFVYRTNIQMLAWRSDNKALSISHSRKAAPDSSRMNANAVPSHR
jgi:hypothetical protein